MGLRPTEAATFFAPTADAAEVLAERRQLLDVDPDRYTALTQAAEPAIDETAEWLLAVASCDVADVATAADVRARLLALGRRLEADLVWMHPRGDDAHRLIAGVVCFPSSWDVHEKLERPMRMIHAPVPGLDEALGRQVDRFLAKLEPGAVWTRENWSVAADPRLNHHPTLPKTPFPDDLRADQVWIRLEHQLLVRMPRSGSVLFAIHVEPVPLPKIVAQPKIAARLARLLETMSPAALDYKRLATARDAIVRLLAPSDDPSLPC